MATLQTGPKTMTNIPVPPDIMALLPRVQNINDLHDEQLTMGARVADRVAGTIGSWRFIIIQSVILIFWLTLNVIGLVHHRDPYPFILLRTDHHDEPEPPVGKRPPQSGRRLPRHFSG